MASSAKAKPTTTIDDIVENYTQRTTNQRIKRLIITADRLNGERHCNTPGAESKLFKVLKELRMLSPTEATAYARQIGVKLP